MCVNSLLFHRSLHTLRRVRCRAGKRELLITHTKKNRVFAAAPLTPNQFGIARAHITLKFGGARVSGVH